MNYMEQDEEEQEQNNNENEINNDNTIKNNHKEFNLFKKEIQNQKIIVIMNHSK